MTAIRAERDAAAAYWCVQHAGQAALDPAQQDAFDAWYDDPANAAAFDEATAAWQAVEGAGLSPEFVRLRSEALDSYGAANRRRWAARPSWRWLGAMAAALLLIVGLAAMLHGRPARYETGIGERRVAMLPDGSRLVLDADTAVDVTLSGDRRALTLLRGRARFDVAKDALRPFTVASGGRLVVATGTSFSVERLLADTRVVLYEGHIAVLRDGDRAAPPRASPAAAITPGHELIVPAGASATPGRIVAVDAEREAAWEAGQISFDDEPLPDAVARINRYGPERVVLDGGGFDGMKVNGVFAAGNLPAFIEGVSALNPVAAGRRGDRIVLRVTGN